MLDLGVNNKSCMIVKLPSNGIALNSKGGKLASLFKPAKNKTITLQILPPKRKLMAQLSSIGEISDNDYNTLYDVFREILSNNREGVSFDAAFVDQFPVSDAVQVLEGYVVFINGIQSRPN